MPIEGIEGPSPPVPDQVWSRTQLLSISFFQSRIDVRKVDFSAVLNAVLGPLKDKLEDMDVSLNFQTRRKGPITFTLNISKTILAVT